MGRHRPAPNSNLGATMSRPFAVASALAFTLAANAATPGAAHADAEPSPTTPAELEQRVGKRLAETRALLEERMTRKNVPEARAALLRARFEAASAKVAAEVARVAAGGAVTKEEAREVRARAHLVRAELRHALRGTHADRAQPCG